MLALRELESLQDVEDELPEKPLKKWRGKFETNSLTSLDFIQYFQAASPFFLVIENKGDSDLGKCIFDEQGAKTAILEVLEEFICGDNPQNILDKLKTEENVPSVCGRVFKIGEPTYCCRECGMDPTCVLCVNCFKQSAHRNHKYKMGTSSGGGCCDCGDIEAWKKDPYCDQHVLGLEQKDDSTVITDKMKEACYIVFQGIMNYCVRSLEIESDASIVGIDTNEDMYCTVLYNDETHTFEQVIQTLTRTLICIHKDAVEYVTSIDREGRAVVKCGSFDVCLKLKADIERQSLRNTLNTKMQPLRVAVLHKKAISYQQFAIQLLSWLQEFLMRNKCFRKIFSEVATQNTDYNINHLLSYDWKLWKTARSSWHRVLISGMLMEYENKKQLAIIFTKLYATIMQDYIRDDHEHSYSIVSLSVQLFTVPTIAHHLIANESAFFILMHTFYIESVEKYVQRKVLQFAKNTANLIVFKRAAYILFDVRYLLNIKPDVWTDDLRKGFLHGMQILIKLLRVMQGMDAVHRQTGSHMEYEPEWESAFNLHIKLAHVISLVLDWCSTDKVVLVKVYRMVLASLAENEFIVSQAKKEVQELADHSVSCLMYDVSSKNVSIHLPLSRFFAGLYLQLEKFGLSYDTISTNSVKPPPDQIIEPVLCTQTMIAQVYAGMWRRNGYSLLNQLYFYRNVKCRSEMLDRDIVVLQIGASLIESNEFLIHVINKFNLMSWASADFEETSLKNPEEDSIRQIINMVDEFLELLIVIIGERYIPGVGVVTEEDRIKKEIIQQLCIKPFSHSELNRTLPDVQHETGMENVIDSVAIFNKPQHSDRKGVYELKPEYYDDYNMYFYHYSKEEKSKSEEEQRKRQKAKSELACCVPPKLPKLTESFSMIANLLQCDVMLLIMQTVLKRTLDLKARSFAESHLQKVLYLIGYALQEEESGNYPFLTFYERATKWEILQLMNDLVSSPRVQAHIGLIHWTIRKFKELQPPDLSVTCNDGSGASTAGGATGFTDDQSTMSDEQEQLEKKNRARLAAERRAKIMAQIANAQKSFMVENAELFENTKTERGFMDSMDWELSEGFENKSIACLGPNRKIYIEDDQVVSCILCSEESIVSKTGPCLVYSCFIQKSTILYGKGREYPHASSCGHVMHANCWQEYFNNEVLKETRRPYRNRSPASFDIDKKEFLCPLCRCLSNGVLPLTPSLPRYLGLININKNPVDFKLWLEMMRSFAHNVLTNNVHDESELRTITEETCSELDDLEGGSNVRSQKSIISVFTTQGNSSPNICHDKDSFYAVSPPILRKISPEIYKFIDLFDFTVQDPMPLQISEKYIDTWLACMYTIQSVEMYLRATEKPLKGQLSIRQTTCLSGLVRISGLLGLGLKEQERKELLSYLKNYAVYGMTVQSILEANVFEMLVISTFMTPTLIYAPNEDGQGQSGLATGQLMEYFMMKLAFLLNMIKIIITYDASSVTQFMDVDMLDIDATEDVDAGTSSARSSGSGIDMKYPNLLTFYQNHNIYYNKDVEEDDGNRVTSQMLINEIKEKSSTFLRSACLLFYFITGVEFPDEFEQINGDTFELMCEYLGLSTEIESYFLCEKSLQFMTSVAMHPTIVKMRKGQKMTTIFPTFIPIRHLVTLPEDYSDLINSVSLFTCPNNDRDDTRNPTMCLVCGEILCSQTYCCQRDIDRSTVGACTYHASSCGNGVAPFLRIRECEILLLGLSKGCFVLPPYLDEYGETDQGLRRGNPLRLCKERYNKLELSWLTHGLHEEIARSIETTNNVTATQWHLL